MEIRASERVDLLGVRRFNIKDKHPAEQKDPLLGRDNLRLDFERFDVNGICQLKKSTVTRPSSQLLTQPDPITVLGTSAQSPQSPSLDVPNDDIVDQLLAKYTTVFEESDGNAVDVP